MADKEGSSRGGSFMDKLKTKLDNTFLDAKVQLTHKKNQIGKVANLVNYNHRHDEAHEKKCDEKRAAICGSHRFQSYFPEHDNNIAKWYVDGRDYFWAVSEALDKARETIYIADWWLSPELYLRRPPHFNYEWRLDQILKRRAEAGVKIYVIVYREVEAALSCNSAHTKNALQNLCPEGSPGAGNIRVMRHPDHNFFENAGDMTFYWAHHEKFIVIDYETAFVGGLDMCFGRWDSQTHALADLRPDGVQNEVWPGQDFNNNRVMDFQNVQDWKNNDIKKTEFGRMPWHDVAMAVVGPCVYDVAEHFVLRWNFIKRDKYKRDARFDWLTLRGREGDQEDLVGVQRPAHPVGEYVLHPLSPLESKPALQPQDPKRGGTVKVQLVRSADDWSNGTLVDHSIQNAYIELIRNAEHYVYIENQFFITATGTEQPPIENTIGSAIVEAVVRNAQRNKKFRVIILIPAVPGFAGDLREESALGTRAIMDLQYKSICRGPHSIFEQIRAKGVDPAQYVFFFNLRNYDRLANTPAIQKMEEAAGVPYHELERLEAEGVMAKSGEREEAQAQGRQQLAQAASQAQTASATTTAPSVARHTMAGQGRLGDEPWDGEAKEEVNNWVQEELYIHAKLLIVDDRYVVCGSSNLNDRSQLGSHDSELSLVMEDTRKLQTRMDGQPFEAGYHAATLRRFLWREHLGLLLPQDLDGSADPNAQPPSANGPPNDVRDQDASWTFVQDALSDDLWDLWTKQATTNTETYRHLFHADPDDHIKNFDEYNRYMPSKGVHPGHIYDPFIPAEDVRSKLEQIKGHLVWMPLDFLKDVPMTISGLQVNQFTESVYA